MNYSQVLEFNEDQNQEICLQPQKVDQQEANKQHINRYICAKLNLNFFDVTQTESELSHHEQTKYNPENEFLFCNPCKQQHKKIKKLQSVRYEPTIQQFYDFRQRGNSEQKYEGMRQNKSQIQDQKQDNLLFFEQRLQESQMKIQLNTYRRKKKRQKLALNYLDKNQIQQQKDTLEQQFKKIENSFSPQFLIVNINKFLMSPLPQNKTIRLTMTRIISFIGYGHQYDLSFSLDNRFLLAAKKVSNSHLTTINFSTKKIDLQENGPFYIGKLKGNFKGTVFNIFSPGLNLENSLKLPTHRREILATIIYSSECPSQKKPRQFIVYVKNSKMNYLKLKGVNKNSQPGLDQLFNIQQNKKYITVYRNKKPIWSQDRQQYSLNFKGRVHLPSIKNFIVEGKNPEEQLIIFGKISENRFNLDVLTPLPPIVGIGVAFTSFYAI